MADYVWQLGIDWNAIQTGGVGYLRGGLLKEVNGGQDVPMAGTNPVQHNDRITFRIFDVTSPLPPAKSPPGRCVEEIVSFGIDSQAAIKDQPPEHPLNKNHPTIGPPIESTEELPQISLFGPASCSWDLEPVEVAATSGRFLLTVYLQAKGTDGVLRLFNHDPEMVVGGTGG